MRSVGKVLLYVVAALGLLAMALAGFMGALWGFADQYASHFTYTVGFKDPGDECGNNDLSVDKADGHPLTCGFGVSVVKLPGFTDEQNDAVLKLSEQLGAGGFTPAERDQLQAEVSGIAASLPLDRRPHHPWLWGWKLGVLGLIGLAVPVTIFRRVTRNTRTQRRRRW
ncbi:hypothetical protein [Kribbella sp. NPDC055071]